MENNNRTGHAQINARGDCVDLASAGSGRRSENPPALAVGSVNHGINSPVSTRQASSSAERLTAGADITGRRS